MSPHDLATRALHAIDPETAHALALKGLRLGLGPVGRRDPMPSTPVDCNENSANHQRLHGGAPSPFRLSHIRIP